MSNYEHAPNPGLAFIIGWIVGSMISTGVQIALHEDPESRIRNTQIQNEQLKSELEQGRDLNGLVLDDREHTFTFHTRSQSGLPEACTGKYEEKDGVVHVVGDLSCSQTVAVVP